MILIILIAAAYAVCGIIVAPYMKKISARTHNTALIFAGAVCVRIIAAAVYPGYSVDMNCFSSWADIAYDGGLYSFYTNGIFSDYPPGYIYILYIVGFINHIFGFNTAGMYFVLKIPAMLCDILCAALLLKTVDKNKAHATLCAALLLFNPAILINSAVWGQVDSVFTIFVLLTMYFIYNKQLYPAYFAFAAAVFIKPQALFYIPVVFYAFAEQVIMNNFSVRRLLRHIAACAAAIIMIVLLALPFNISAVISQYRDTIGSYNFASVNAYNLWTALGLNWHKPNAAVTALGYAFIIMIVAVSAYIYFRKKADNRCFFVSAFICFSTFMLSIKMHDRYAYPAILLMLFSYALSENKNELWLFLGITFFQFINAAHVLFYYDAETYYSTSFGTVAICISIAATVFFAVMWAYTLKQKGIYKK